jgi:hypothetical protein
MGKQKKIFVPPDYQVGQACRVGILPARSLSERSEAGIFEARLKKLILTDKQILPVQINETGIYFGSHC